MKSILWIQFCTLIAVFFAIAAYGVSDRLASMINMLTASVWLFVPFIPLIRKP